MLILKIGKNCLLAKEKLNIIKFVLLFSVGNRNGATKTLRFFYEWSASKDMAYPPKIEDRMEICHIKPRAISHERRRVSSPHLYSRFDSLEDDQLTIENLMQKNNTNYQPIDCNLYDEVILLIMRKQKIKIDYKNDAGKELEAETILKDVFAKEGEEFILLENGETIRLDRLLKIDGQTFEGYCGI